MENKYYGLYKLKTSNSLIFSNKYFWHNPDYPTYWHMDEEFPGYLNSVSNFIENIDDVIKYVNNKNNLSDLQIEILKNEIQKAIDENYDLEIVLPLKIKFRYNIQNFEEIKKYGNDVISLEQLNSKILIAKQDGVDYIEIIINNEFQIQKYDKNKFIKLLDKDYYGLKEYEYLLNTKVKYKYKNYEKLSSKMVCFSVDDVIIKGGSNKEFYIEVYFKNKLIQGVTFGSENSIENFKESIDKLILEHLRYNHKINENIPLIFSDTVNGLLVGYKGNNNFLRYLYNDYYYDEIYPGYKTSWGYGGTIDQFLDFFDGEWYGLNLFERIYLKNELTKSIGNKKDIVISRDENAEIEINELNNNTNFYQNKYGVARDYLIKQIELAKEYNSNKATISLNTGIRVYDYDRNNSIKKLNGEDFGIKAIKKRRQKNSNKIQYVLLRLIYKLLGKKI